MKDHLIEGELFNTLKTLGFIVHKDADEKKAILDRVNKEYEKASTLGANKLWLFINDNCNLRCVYCYQNKGKRVLDDDSLKRAIRYFSSKNRGSVHINLIGGEPLLYPDKIRMAIMEALKYFGNYRASFRIITNGTTVSDDLLLFIKPFKVTFVVTIDGNKNIHNKMRPYQNRTGTYEDIIYNLKQMKKFARLHIKMNLTESNYGKYNDFFGDIESIMDRDLKVTIETVQFHKNYKGKNNYLEFGNAFDDLNAFLEKNKNLKIHPDSTFEFNPFYNAVRKNYICGYQKGGVMVVNPDGNLVMCGQDISDQFKIGSLKKGIDRTGLQKWKVLDTKCADCSKFRFCHKCPIKMVNDSGYDSPFCDDENFNHFVIKFARSENLI